MKKVFVVGESTPFNTMLVDSIKQTYGYECITAASYEKVKIELKERQGYFFCAVVDPIFSDAPNGEVIDLVLANDIATIVIADEITDSLRDELLQKEVADYVLKLGQHNIDYITSVVNRLCVNSGIKVLVVDDSVTSRQQISRLLAIQQFEVIQAASGEQALEALAKNPDIRIAFIDAVIGGLNGCELTSVIRETYSKETLTIIGVSPQSAKIESVRFIKNGANDFINKPFLPEELNCRVNQIANFINQLEVLKAVSEQKNQFVGMAAHDIRGSLGVIRGVGELLLKKERSPDQQKKFVEMILKSSTEMLVLLNNLLDITAIESGKFSVRQMECSFTELVQERIDFNRNLSEKKEIDLVAKIPELPPILIDTSRIKQVIDNLISNAIKYSPLSSEVEVRLTETPQSQRLEVRDHGPGIRPSEVGKLFGVFQRLSNKTTGGESSSGLGLAICKNLVEAHDGKIGYEPNAYGGSCFYFELPKVG